MHAVRSGSRPRRDAVPSWTKAERNQIIEFTSDYHGPTVSYENVKAALVDHIDDNVGAWLALEKVSAWPADPALVGSFEILPEGDEHWPCVAVTALKSVDADVATGGPPGVYMSVYDMVVTVGCKSAASDVESAASGRDRLLQAVRNLLKAVPSPTSGVRGCCPT